jgi:hypothetical protein
MLDLLRLCGPPVYPRPTLVSRCVCLVPDNSSSTKKTKSNVGCIFFHPVAASLCANLFCQFCLVPDGLAAPIASADDARTLTLTWSPPTHTHGDMIVYFLYKVESTYLETLYAGLNTNVSVGNLKPYTQYKFALEACNDVGCTASNVTTITTPQSG